MLPVEFCVAGTPISHQSHNKPRLDEWRSKVAAAAKAAVPEGAQPTDVPVELHVVYYFEQGSVRLPDEDNLLKPVQDALNGVVYVDDSQVVDGACSKRDIDGSFRVRRMSASLAGAFVSGETFVHVVVRDAPDPEVLRP